MRFKRVVPVLALAILFIGCSQVDSPSTGSEKTPTTAPETLGGNHGGGGGGHHHNGCDPAQCTCPNHQACGGMGGQMTCGENCPGCQDHCGGGEGHGHHNNGGGKHQHEHGGGHGEHGGHEGCGGGHE